MQEKINNISALEWYPKNQILSTLFVALFFIFVVIIILVNELGDGINEQINVQDLNDTTHNAIRYSFRLGTM